MTIVNSVLFERVFFSDDYVMKKLANGFPRIWQDVQTKVKVLVNNSSVNGLSIDTFIRIIDTIHLLIEIGRKFCGSESDSLQASLKEQCLAYFRSYHQERLEELKMHLDNEGWAMCPVKPTFKVSQLKEFQHLSLQQANASNFLGSPRKMSVRSIMETTNEFIAPFEKFLDESVLEEDFLMRGEDQPDAFQDSEDEDSLPDELTRDFIDEEDNSSNAVTSAPIAPKKKHKKLTTKKTAEIPILSNTSLMMLRLFGKYLHLMQMLEPISTDVFKAMTQLLDYYLVNVHTFFLPYLVS